MVIKEIDVINYINALGKLINNQNIPGKLALAMARNERSLENENASFEIVRKKLLDKYIEKDHEGNVIFDSDGKNPKLKDEESCNEEFRELLEMETEVEIVKVSSDIFDNISGISASELVGIDFMIE